MLLQDKFTEMQILARILGTRQLDNLVLYKNIQ